MSEIDPRLERHRPALRYDSQEAYRAMSAASITDNAGNVLLAGDNSVIARAGEGLSLELLSAYPPPASPDDDDKLDEAPDPLSAARELQANPAYADRCYGRVKPDGGRTWLQYWLWYYDNPKNLLGFGRHEGDWELVQIGLGENDEPEVVTLSAHAGGEARDWDKVQKLGAHPVVFVAPFSHANYFEDGAHPYLIGVDNPDGAVDHVLPRVEPLGDWAMWPGRWGSSTGVLAKYSGGRLGGRSPAGPGHQGNKFKHPAVYHRRAAVSTPARRFGQVVRAAGRAHLPAAAADLRAAGGQHGRGRLRARPRPVPRRLAAAGHGAPGRARGGDARQPLGADPRPLGHRPRAAGVAAGRRRRGAGVGVQPAAAAQRPARDARSPLGEEAGRAAVLPPARRMRRGVRGPRGWALTNGFARGGRGETTAGQLQNENRCISSPGVIGMTASPRGGVFASSPRRLVSCMR